MNVTGKGEKMGVWWRKREGEHNDERKREKVAVCWRRQRAENRVWW